MILPGYSQEGSLKSDGDDEPRDEWIDHSWTSFEIGPRLVRLDWIDLVTYMGILQQQ